MWLAPVRRRSLADSVFEQLRDHIVEGEAGPGTTLPAERALADQLGVNRQAVREGIKRLEQAGLVSVRQGEGTRVLDFRRTGGLELLASLAAGPDGIRNDVARALLELRAALAPEVARASAQRATPAVHARIGRITDEMQAFADDLSRLQELALEFWAAVVEGSDNVAYSLACNTLDRTFRQMMPHLTDVLAAELRAVELYAAVASAIRVGDGRVAAQAASRIVALGVAAAAGEPLSPAR